MAYLIVYMIVSLLTYASYLRVALQDPGYIKTVMFNKAYQAETEVNVSAQTLPDRRFSDV